MQQSYPSRNEVYTYKIYLKNRSPHLEPSYLPFLSYSVGSLNEQKGEAQRSGKEKKRSSYTPVHDSPYRNTHVMKQTGPGHSGSSVLRSNSLSGDPARDHSPPRVPAAGRCHTCRRSECLPALEASTPRLPLQLIGPVFDHSPVKGKRIYHLNCTLLQIFLSKGKPRNWEAQLKTNQGGAFPSGRKQPSQFVVKNSR